MEDEKEIILSLYVSDMNINTQKAILEIKKYIKEIEKHVFKLEVIDILEQPDRAVEDGVLATPMIIKENPPPIMRVILDFTEKEKLVMGIGLLFE